MTARARLKKRISAQLKSKRVDNVFFVTIAKIFRFGKTPHILFTKRMFVSYWRKSKNKERIAWNIYRFTTSAYSRVHLFRSAAVSAYEFLQKRHVFINRDMMKRLAYGLVVGLAFFFYSNFSIAASQSSPQYLSFDIHKAISTIVFSEKLAYPLEVASLKIQEFFLRLFGMYLLPSRYSITVPHGFSSTIIPSVQPTAVPPPDEAKSNSGGIENYNTILTLNDVVGYGNSTNRAALFNGGLYGGQGSFSTLGVSGSTVIGDPSNSGDISFEVYSKHFILSSNGNVTMSAMAGAGLSDCSSVGSKLMWSSATNTFSCGVDRFGGGGGGGGGSSEVDLNSLDFDEFVDAMTLDADTTITGGAYAFTFDHASVSGNFEVTGNASASATFGSGLTDCTGDNKLTWDAATGHYICAPDGGANIDTTRTVYVDVGGTCPIVDTSKCFITLTAAAAYVAAFQPQETDQHWEIILPQKGHIGHIEEDPLDLTAEAPITIPSYTTVRGSGGSNVESVSKTYIVSTHTEGPLFRTGEYVSFDNLFIRWAPTSITGDAWMFEGFMDDELYLKDSYLWAVIPASAFSVTIAEQQRVTPDNTIMILHPTAAGVDLTGIKTNRVTLHNSKIYTFAGVPGNSSRVGVEILSPASNTSEIHGSIIGPDPLGPGTFTVAQLMKPAGAVVRISNSSVTDIDNPSGSIFIAQPYGPTNTADWVDPDPETDQEAFDQLAQRLTDEEARAAGTIAVREGDGAFSDRSSVSFDAGHFSLTYPTASEAYVRLDWGAGGPASLSQDETVTGFWNFTAASTQLNGLELTNAASIGGNVIAQGNGSFGGTLSVTGNTSLSNASVSGNFETTVNGATGNHFKLTDSSTSTTVGLSNNDGDFQIRIPSVSGAFSDEYVAFKIASASGATQVGVPKPTFKSHIAGAGVPNYLDGANVVKVQGKYAYVTSIAEDALSIFDISNPASATFEGSISGAGAPNYLNFPAYDFAISGGYAYIPAGLDSSLTVIDVSNPSNPRFAGRLAISIPLSVEVSGKYAYVTENGSALDIVDISDPTSPKLAGRISGAGAPNYLGNSFNVRVKGNYAYVTANTDDSLTVVDVSNPSKPKIVGHIAGAGAPNYLDGAKGIAVSGKYAYVSAIVDDSMTIIDVSDPTNPKFVGNIAGAANFLDGTESLYVSGNYVYATAESGSFVVIDVSNPAAPTRVSQIGGAGSPNFLGIATFVFVSGRYAYIAANADDSLTIIDLGGLDTPTLYAGDASIGNLNVQNTFRIGSDLYIGNGLTVGSNLLVNGRIGAGIASLSATAASSSAEPLFRLSHGKGYLSGDALTIDLSTGGTQEYFTGDFARFSLANTDRIIFESSGAILASGSAQFGSAGAPASLSYSRFGTGTTTHSNYISAANDLFITGDLEVRGSGSFAIASASQVFVGLSSPVSATFALCHSTNGAAASGEEIQDCNTTVSADYMEFYPAMSGVEEGDVVVADAFAFALTRQDDRVAEVRKSSQPYDGALLGIVSVAEQATDFNSVGRNLDPEDNPLPIALSGRVKVKVSSENGPIAVGDRLTSSSVPGVAMKATEAGTVIGTALEPLDATRCESANACESTNSKIMVFVNVGYWAPSADTLLADNLQDSTGSDSQSADQTLSGGLFAHIVKMFNDLYHIAFEDGIIKAVRGIFSIIAVDEIQMKDRATGDIYCVSITDGELVKEKCNSISPPPPEVNIPPTPEANASPTPEFEQLTSPTTIPTPDTTESPPPELGSETSGTFDSAAEAATGSSTIGELPPDTTVEPTPDASSPIPTE